MKKYDMPYFMGLRKNIRKKYNWKKLQHMTRKEERTDTHLDPNKTANMRNMSVKAIVKQMRKRILPKNWWLLVSNEINKYIPYLY